MRAILFRSLATLFASGVPLIRALELLAEQQESPRLAQACQGIARKVSEGNYLSRALQQYPDVFRPAHHKMVQSGERSGRLHSVLMKLAESEERTLQLQQNLRGALVMPLVVSGFCILLAVLAPPYFFGGLFTMIREVGGSLPWTTQLLMGFSEVVRRPWFLLALAGLGWGLVQGVGRLAREADWQFRLLQVPLLGPSLRLYMVARFSENLASMLEVGVPLLTALEQAARAVDAACLDQVVGRVSGLLREGEALSKALEATDFFPAVLVQGVRAGEEAGGLTTMLTRLHGLFVVELEQRLEMTSKALEPLVLCVVGAIVAFTLVATLQPLLSVMDRL